MQSNGLIDQLQDSPAGREGDRVAIEDLGTIEG